MVIMSSSTCKSIPNQKASKRKKKKKTPVNNTVSRLILDKGSCEKLHKKFGFAEPFFITSSIILFYFTNLTEWRNTKGVQGYLPFTRENRKFQLENKMVRAILFGKLQKIWAVI